MIRHASRAVGSALILALGLAACGGGGGMTPQSAPVVQPPPPASYNGPASLANFAWGKPLLSQLSYTGPASGGGLSLIVQVNMRDAAGLVRYAQQASDPKSALYRHWLTPQQIATQYGASASDYATVANYFASNGLRVGGWPQREALTVTGSLQQMQRAFGTAFGTYNYQGTRIIAPTGTPHFSTALPVVSVTGLVGATPQHGFMIHGNNATFYGYAPQQIATGFDFSGAYNSGFNGNGIKVGIIGTGPILSNNAAPDPDTAALGAFWNASMGTVTQVNASPQPASTINDNTGTIAEDPNPTGLATAPPVTASCNQATPGFPNYAVCNPEDTEAQLDTESIASLAPGASTLFYLAYNPIEYCYNATTGYYTPVSNACNAGDTAYQAEGIQLTDDEIQQAIADNTADAISMSFGEPENAAVYYGYINTPAVPGVGQIEMASLSAEGIALFASSGDNGAWECKDPSTGLWLGTPCANYPASDPNVVAVGGVNIPLDESGNLTGLIAAWADNTTQGGNGSFGNNVGSGGGVSTVFPAPAWQSDTTGASMRELPDMSLDADPNTGPSIVINAGVGAKQVFAEGGTSAAAPEAAAQWGIVLQACKASSTCNKGGATGYRLGNPAPLYYAIYGTQNSLATGAYTSAFTPTLGYAGVFYDVLYGDNQGVPAPNPAPTPVQTPNGYNAGPGYDQVTGVGAPFTGHLIQAVTGTKTP